MRILSTLLAAAFLFGAGISQAEADNSWNHHMRAGYRYGYNNPYAQPYAVRPVYSQGIYRHRYNNAFIGRNREWRHHHHRQWDRIR